MSQTRTQMVVLAVLLVVLAAAMWRQLSPAPVGPRGADGGAAGTDAVESGTVVAELEIGRLEKQPGEYSPGRDLFRFGARPRPEPRQPTEEELEAARLAREAAARRAAETRAAVAAQPVRPTPPTFGMKFLGSFGSKVRRIAVFSKGPQIINALEGDVLEGKFIVDRIGYESADIKFVGFPDTPSQRLAAGG